jgi:hypothetical protein
MRVSPCERFIEGWSCPRCGDFFLGEHLSLDTTLNRTLRNDTQRAVLSHWIRTRNESIARESPHTRPSPIALNSELVASIIKNPLPSVAEQAAKFILWLGASKNPPGELVVVEPETHQSIMGAMTPKGFSLVVDELVQEDLLKNVTAPLGNKWTITLSYKGWQQYDKLKRGAVDSRKAFMAMPYGKEELDGVVEKVFRPAVKQAGFDLSRLDDPDQPAGLIDDRLRVAIQTSRFLIADLTHGNPGAYWEAGYAEGLGRPVIYTCRKEVFENSKSCPHFDTNHHLTILWDIGDPQEAGEKLKTTIRATLPAEAKLTDD